MSGSLPHLRKSPMQTCAFPLGHVVCMQTCAFPHVGIGFAPPSRCFHRMSEIEMVHYLQALHQFNGGWLLS